MSLAYPQTDGPRESFASIEVKIGTKVFFMHAINYSRTRSRGMAKGNNPDPAGKTRGSNEYKADAEMFLGEFKLLVAALGGDGYGDKFFDVTVTYTENGIVTMTDSILGCTLDSTEASNTQGDDATVRKFDLAPLKVLFGGVDDNATPLSKQAYARAA